MGTLPVTFLEAKMKQWVIAGLLAGSIGVAAAAARQPAQQPPATQKPSGQSSTTTQKPAGQQPATTATPGQTTQGEQPARRARRTAAGAEANAPGGHVAPKEQPNTAAEPPAPTAAMALGRVRIPAGVSADGKPLASGSYDVRLTADEAKPNAAGSTEKLERWVEFVQGGTVKAREVVSIVPESEIKLVQKDTPPRAGSSKVERLKGGDYVRVWINRGGTHYLIHLPASGTGH